jgi:flagellar hook assembly protein FlgD
MALLIALTFLLAGCEDSTVSTVVLSNTKITEESALNSSANTTIQFGKDLYANVLFIESPKGMKYTAKWIKDKETLKTDEQKMTSDKKGVISFELDGSKVTKGNYTIGIDYKDKKIYSENFTVN